MRVRLVALAASAGVVAAFVPAHAASGPKPQIVDAIGDANFINNQAPGLGPEPPTVQTAPADLSGADISTVLFATNWVTKKVHGKKVKVANGFTLTMTLAAATMPDIEYRVSGATGDCTSVFFEYSTAPGLGGSDARCPATPPATEVDYGITATASGNKIVWVVPNGVFHNGTVFSSLNAQTRTVIGAVTAPQVDYATSDATYAVGK